MNKSNWSIQEAIIKRVEAEDLYEWSKTKNAPLSSKQMKSPLKKSLIKRLPSLILP